MRQNSSSVSVVAIASLVAFGVWRWQKRDKDEKDPPPPKLPPRRLPTTRQDAKILQPLALRGATLKNRIVRAAAFGGSRLDELIRTHTEVVRGGAAMTTIAYASVSQDGRTFDSQILLTAGPSLVGELQQLTRAVHQASAGAKISLQLTHAGFFADRKVTGVRQVAPSPCFSPAGLNWAREMTDQDLERVAEDFVQAAVLAEEAGFDAVELHCGHGYLLSQFLSPATNWRRDAYGGSAINRVRYPLEILKRIRQATKLVVLVKMNVQDGFAGGMTPEDALCYAKAFAPFADALVLSGGFTSRNGFFMLRGRVPSLEMARAMGWGIKGLAVVLFGKWLVPEIEFKECFFYEPALAILKAVGNVCPVCLVGGITSLSSMEGLMDDGFGMVQMARGLIQNPHLVNDIKDSLATTTPTKDMEDIQSACHHCNECVVTTLDPRMEMKCPIKV